MGWFFDSFFEMSALFIAFWMTGAIIAVACVPYLVLKNRDLKRIRHDPQIGIKIVLHFLLTIAVEGTVIGLTLILIDLLTGPTPTGFLDDTFRIGLSYALAGALLSGGYLYVLFMHTNDRAWPAARRAYSGIRVMLAGLIVTFSFTWTFASLLGNAENRGPGELEMGVAVFIIWAVAAALEFFFFARAVRKPEVPGLDTRCVNCGYDLRVTLANRGAACTECGVKVPQEQYEVVAAEAENARNAGMS